MRLDSTLRKHIVDVDIQAKESLEILMKQMLEKNPIDENLKDTDPLKWTGLMNSNKHSAEEIIFKELIYIYKKKTFQLTTEKSFFYIFLFNYILIPNIANFIDYSIFYNIGLSIYIFFIIYN